MIEIRVDVDKEKQQAATQEERSAFLTWLFDAASRATADFGAEVDFSDAHHWIIRVPEQHEKAVRGLLNA